MSTTICAYWQNICERRLQAKKKDKKTTQNEKVLKTKSPNFGKAKILKN